MQHKSLKFCRNILFASIASISFLSACATPQAPPAPVEDPVLTILNIHASRVSASMQKMSEAEGTSKVRQSASNAQAVSDKNTKVSQVELKIPVAGAIDEHIQVASSDPLSGESPPLGLEKKITMGVFGGNFYGYSDTVESTVSKICAATGWKKGRSEGVPVTPIVVTIPSSEQTAFSLLIYLGGLLNRSADIVISEKDRTVTIVYPVK